ncbi:MAG: hypothetical protein AAGD32_05685 [Planctomycetota bacterium]
MPEERPKTPEEHDPSKPIAEQPDHSMKDEEPLGWDQAPLSKPEWQRHPRPNMPGGVPKQGE